MDREIRQFDTKRFHEAYRKIGDEDNDFDIRFWQTQGAKAIFDAAWKMVLDSLMLRSGDAVEPRLQRTVEHYGKL
jgi:hypothetical protein